MGRRRKYRQITPELRREVMRLAGQGLSYRQILERVDMSMGGVQIVLRPLGGVIRKDMLESTGRRLGLEERIEIRCGLDQGLSVRAVAARVGRAPSTVWREVEANGGRHRYRPVAAHRRAWQRARRPKVTKLAAHPALCARVIADLRGWWSPLQITRRLVEEAASGGSLGVVSHETIYKSIYIQGRGELRRELARCLRSGRAVRRPQGRIETRGRIKNMVMISQRPAEVADRAVPGHWEGDLIVGNGGNSHIATLVERSTRYVMLAKVSNAKADTVAAALVATVARLPQHLWRSLTWDQGAEMAGHEFFTVETGIPVYFCDPHSPWQRGSNENTNGLLRQYFPKGTSLRGYSQDDLDRAAISLNGRPRETLGWQTPAERLTELLVATTG
jgi:transposase, IS30 family